MSDRLNSVEAAASAASAAASVALKGSVAGSTVAAVGAAAESSVVAYVGLALTAATFVINWYYRHKEYRLRRQELKHKGALGDTGEGDL